MEAEEGEEVEEEVVVEAEVVEVERELASPGPDESYWAVWRNGLAWEDKCCMCSKDASSLDAAEGCCMS